MLRYRDTGAGGPDVHPGAWFDQHLVPDAQAFRAQFGFSRFKALRKYAQVLQQMARSGRVVNLVLGSNGSDPLTVQDLRASFELLRGGEQSHLTVVTYSGALFHPKVAQIVDAAGTAHAIVGSANLTEQAFGKHVEAWIELDAGHALTDEPLRDIAHAIDRWHGVNEVGVYQILSADDIAGLLTGGIVVDEAARRARLAAARNAGEGIAGGGRRGTRPVRWRAPDAEEEDAGEVVDAEVEEPLDEDEGEEAGELAPVAAADGPLPAPGRVLTHRWSKRLSASDVNKNDQNERNLISLGVGGREGTTARVMRDMNDIRDRMMAGEAWQAIRISGEASETTTLGIEVRLPGEPMNIHRLQIVHAPHRGAGQANYHTSIRWDADLAERLRTAPDRGFVDHWATLDRFDTGEYALTITRERPNPRTFGMGV